jgi:ABC-type transport system involved in cytochrome bd biosynthesis fused ATPase/permease subunit
MRDLALLAAIKAIESRHCLVSFPVIAQLALLESPRIHLLIFTVITAYLSFIFYLFYFVIWYLVFTQKTPSHQNADHA